VSLVVADTGSLISLAHAGQISLIEKLHTQFYLAEAVWEELNKYDHPNFDKTILSTLHSQVVPIKSKNYLSTIMDYGESESIILYEELQADYLLIDDRKARQIAESLQVNCIGSIGLLIKAKQAGIISELRPIFVNWLETERYFSIRLLNQVLEAMGENTLLHPSK
jgi:uncharacterized protein